MRKQDALLDHNVANAISPYWKTILESKFGQVVGALQIQLAAGAFFRAQRNHVTVAEAEKFRNMAPASLRVRGAPGNAAMSKP